MGQVLSHLFLELGKSLLLVGELGVFGVLLYEGWIRLHFALNLEAGQALVIDFALLYEGYPFAGQWLTRIVIRVLRVVHLFVDIFEDHPGGVYIPIGIHEPQIGREPPPPWHPLQIEHLIVLPLNNLLTHKVLQL